MASARPLRYRHDVFVSYSRMEGWPAFANDHLLPILRHWLSAELGREAKFFQDVVSVQAGQQWPMELERGVASSRVIVALFSRDYFGREWCRRELAMMLKRADEFRPRGLPDGLIFPLAIHDCENDHVPQVVRSIQRLDISSYANPFMHGRSRLRERLSRLLVPFCADVAGRIREIPDRTSVWPVPDYSKYEEQLRPARRLSTAPTVR